MRRFFKKQAKDLTELIQEAQTYLDKLEKDPSLERDPALLYSYLDTLLPGCSAPQVPADLLRTVATLYFETGQYQEAAMILKRLRGHTRSDLQVRCDFFNGYCVTSYDWETRQLEIQQIIRDMESSLTFDRVGSLRQALDHCFPTHLLTIVPEEKGQGGIIQVGNPDGIYSLFPMNYLVRHTLTPQNWYLDTDTPGSMFEALQLGDKTMDIRDVQVRITLDVDFLPGTKVNLALWHPLLQEMIQFGMDREADLMANCLAYGFFSTETATLYVSHVSAAEEPFGDAEKGTVLLLEDINSWFQSHHLEPQHPMPHLLRNRVYAFTRQPVMETRPRGDIIRGETCMPELEEIYFLRNGKGMASLQRYGVGYWFLILPKAVCGDDFPAFRDTLIQAVRATEHDTVCFTGWAEGTCNCYLDFLSLSSNATLHALKEYLDGLPGGKDVRIASFYWNSIPRTLDVSRELAKQAEHPEEVAPVQEQVSAQARADLEKTFRETRWEKTGQAADWAVEDSSLYQEKLDLLETAALYITSCNNNHAQYDYFKLHYAAMHILPVGDPSEMDETFCIHMSTLLLAQERFRESAHWISPVSNEDCRVARLYSCDIGNFVPCMNHWELRRQTFWKQFAAVEPDIVQSITGGGDPQVLQQFNVLADATFPYHEAVLFNDLPSGKHVLLTGLPGGILTLPAMLYLVNHYPANISRRWTIAISQEGAIFESVPTADQVIATREVQVSLAENDGKVSLTLWHPQLSKIAREHPDWVQTAATRLVNAVLSMGARLLYVADVTAASSEPEDAFPLPDLMQKLRDLGYQPNVPLDTLLSRRRYTITRSGQYKGRPRTDILRGETCMPELERIYNRLYEEGQVILDRHGIFALFLMIPNQICNGNPAQYLQQLQRYLSLAEGDKIFFTGWAEGEKYCYLDLLSLDGTSLLEKLNEYATSHSGGKDLRFCTFYWQSRLLPWILKDVPELMPDRVDGFAQYAKAHLAKDFPVPDAKAAAALEASFHPEFKPEDFCTAKPAEAPAPAAQQPAFGKKKLSKAQRKAQNSKNNQNNKGGKNGKKKR